MSTHEVKLAARIAGVYQHDAVVYVGRDLKTTPEFHNVTHVTGEIPELTFERDSAFHRLAVLPGELERITEEQIVMGTQVVLHRTPLGTNQVEEHKKDVSFTYVVRDNSIDGDYERQIIDAINELIHSKSI